MKKILAALMVSAGMLASSVAFAQPPAHHHKAHHKAHHHAKHHHKKVAH